MPCRAAKALRLRARSGTKCARAHHAVEGGCPHLVARGPDRVLRRAAPRIQAKEGNAAMDSAFDPIVADQDPAAMDPMDPALDPMEGAFTMCSLLKKGSLQSKNGDPT